MNLRAGWIAQDLALPDQNHGVYVPRFSIREQQPFPTRTEEYHLVASCLEEEIRGLVLDAGCGFNPEIHVLPEILANMGYQVLAIDANPAVLAMPPVAGVERRCGTMAYLGDLPAASVDHWVCVSVLEHLEPTLRMATTLEAFRLLKPGGLAVITADDVSPDRLNILLAESGFDIGPIVSFTGTLTTPPVAYATGRKP